VRVLISLNRIVVPDCYLEDIPQHFVKLRGSRLVFPVLFFNLVQPCVQRKPVLQQGNGFLVGIYLPCGFRGLQVTGNRLFDQSCLFVMRCQLPADRRLIVGIKGGQRLCYLTVQHAPPG